MRLESVTVENIRGIRDLSIDLEGDNYAIAGPNGSGKSAVADALDFLLTGSISRLQGEATGNLRISEHGPHIECDDPSNARVEATLLTREGETVSISRNFSDRHNWTLSDESHQNSVRRLFESAQQGYHLLTRADILSFIFSTPGDRGEKVENLLRLESIDPVRRSLNRASEELETKADLEREKRETAKENLRRLVGAEGEPLSVVVQRLEDCRSYLGSDSGVDLEQGEVSFRSNLSSPVETIPETPLRSEFTREKIQELQGWYEGDRNVLIDDLEGLFEEIHDLQGDEELIRELKTGELIELGLETLDAEDEECPLCLEPWDYDELRQLLSERQETLQEAEERRDSLREDKADLLGQIRDIESTVAAVIEACREEDDLDLDPLTGLRSELSGLEDMLATPVTAMPSLDREAGSVEERLEGDAFQSWHSTVQERIDRLTDYEPLDELWDLLRDASRLYNSFTEYADGHRKLRAALSNAKTVSNAFQEARRQVLNELYDSVAVTMAGYYKVIHAPDEDEFDVELVPLEAGLDLRVPFYDQGLHPPHALHSEGHQDTMGLCLYLALHHELASDSIGFMSLDDVISSIDASHRRGVVDLLSRRSDSVQLFLTTHDNVFLNHLRSEGVIKSSRCRRFTGWDLATGPKEIPSLADPWRRVKKLLDEGDVSGAAARLRRTGEWFLREAAGRLKAPVVYSLDHRWSLGEFVWPVLDRIRSLVKDARKAANSWGRDTSEIEAFNERRKSVYNDWYSESGKVNPNIHYREDEWANFTPEDLANVMQAYRALYDLLRCSTCGALARVLREDHEDQQIVCKCGDTFNWSLEQK